MFDELEFRERDPEVLQKPFYKFVKKPKDERLEWLTGVTDALIDQAEDRTRVQREHLMLYRGVSHKLRERTIDRDRNIRKLNKLQKFVVNHLYDLTETKVSQMNRIKPAIEVMPVNDEWQDRASAKVVKFINDHLWRENDIDFKRISMHRHARIFGESFMFITWNKNKGDLTPEYVAGRDAGLDVDKLVKSGKLQKHVGDLEYNVELPWRVFAQRKEDMRDSEYVFRLSIRPVDELKDEYPRAEINEDEEFHHFNMENLEESFIEKHCLVMEFWHKKTKYLPDGYYAKFTMSSLLEEDDAPQELLHGKLPFVRITDLDVPGVMNGVSRFETISSIQGMYNNISTLIAKNIYLTAHAKWVMPRGAAKIEQLGNDNTVIQFQGPVAPKMIQAQPNAPEVYAFRQQLKEDMQTIYGSHGISRGEVPKGITAASALQFLNELESERATTDISKDGFLIKDIAKMGIAVAGAHYKVDDGRMIRIVGQNNQFLIRHFDTAHLHKPYDIRMETSTGLPETKSAKIQRILDAMQRNPKMVSPERWEYLLELADTEKMSTLATEAIKAADSIVEDIFAGREVAGLEDWQDLIIHWETYIKAMQSRAFNEEADPAVRNKLKDHVYWTEKAMLNKSSKNPEFEAKLAQLTLFPIFNHDDFEIPKSREHQLAMIQGQANRGDAVSGVIPGTSPQEMREIEFAKEQMKR
jgi:hypothetical protein